MTETKATNKNVDKAQTNKNKDKNFVANLLGLNGQEKTIGLLGMGLVVAAFFSGFFYGQLTVLKNGNFGSVAGAQAPNQADPTAQAPEDTGPLSDEMWQLVLAEPAAAKGPEDAKVTIVEFTDYQCPFCARHFTETDSLIQENYVKAGKVRHITRDLPLPFHSNANAAAQAARCAGDQNNYWEMHDLLFENQDAWGVGSPNEKFSGYAGELGLNTSTFDTCLSSEKYKEAVDADLALANQVGASGTPTFFINGQKLVGAQPYSAFEAVIEAEL